MRIQALTAQLRVGLAAIPRVTVQDLGLQQGAPQCGIVTFTHHRIAPEAMKERLAAQRIIMNSSIRSSTLLDMQARCLGAVARASVHYYNNEEEVARFLSAIAQL